MMVSLVGSCIKQNGNRGNAQRAARNAAYAGAQGGFREQPMTPEELFNMFFEAQGVRRQQHFQRQRHYANGDAQQGQGQRGGLMNLAHFLPLILLFLFSFMSGPSTESTVFSYVTHSFTPPSCLPSTIACTQ
jgi:hypothetical protein